MNALVDEAATRSLLRDIYAPDSSRRAPGSGIAGQTLA
jgi:hypothetical protein